GAVAQATAHQRWDLAVGRERDVALPEEGAVREIEDALASGQLEGEHRVAREDMDGLEEGELARALSGATQRPTRGPVGAEAVDLRGTCGGDDQPAIGEEATKGPRGEVEGGVALVGTDDRHWRVGSRPLRSGLDGGCGVLADGDPSGVTLNNAGGTAPHRVSAGAGGGEEEDRGDGRGGAHGRLGKRERRTENCEQRKIAGRPAIR